MTTLLQPRYWAGHLLALVALSAAVFLGWWQYSAWSAHRASVANDVVNKPAVALETLITPDGTFLNKALARQVSFSGVPLPQYFYISDRPLAGKVGYWVVVPVKVDGTDSLMPVVLGWAPERVEPTLPARMQITGWLQPSEPAGDPDPDPDDNVLPQLRIASLTSKIDADLYSAFVLTKTPNLPGLFVVEPLNTPQVGAFNSLRNLLYGFQWWIFGAFAVVVWVRWCRDELASVSQVHLGNSD
ncbi:MAG TPA: SURF1 family protein [Marmoricola sp.]|nr:SURF1 family protein [Marmoricola sp.]